MVLAIDASLDTSLEQRLEHQPLKVQVSEGFYALLAQYGLSVLVSTYQAGKVFVLRAGDRGLNVHFRNFKKAMGMAANHTRLAVGTHHEVWELYNMPAVAPKLSGDQPHDACYLTRNRHVTGNIDIHEMAWAKEVLWVVNTRFSCLCTLDSAYSFVPRWRPPFVSALAAEDRCHLNGLAVVNNMPKYVTALGTADTVQGWREHKATGGILMDIGSNEIVVQGLSMPHSPRWYDQQLWVLESGQGSLARVDQQQGTVQSLVQLPGFTRGLDFHGPLAFVGLSQVRESATFSGLPLTERLTERTCGVWVVDLRTGQTVAWLKFESGVQEIFAVQVLSGIRFPEVLPEEETLVASVFALPDEALAQVVQPEKNS